MLEIQTVSLFDGDTKKENVVGRIEYTHFKREKIVNTDEEGKKSVSYKYYIVTNINYYTSTEKAESPETNQPFFTDITSQEITEAEYDSIMAKAYPIAKKLVKYADCREV